MYGDRLSASGLVAESTIGDGGVSDVWDLRMQSSNH